MKQVEKAGGCPFQCKLRDIIDIFGLQGLHVDPSKPVDPITIASIEGTCRFIVSSASAFRRTATRRRPGLARNTS